MKKSFIIWLHLGYWILFLLLVACFLLLIPGTSRHYSFRQLMGVMFFSPVGFNIILPGVTGFYLFYTILFTKLLSEKKILALSVSGIAVCVLTSVFFLLLSSWVLPTYRPVVTWAEKISMVFFLSLLVMIHGIIGLVIRGFISWYTDIKWKEELNARNFETELALVKSQIHPHFLFNSINNIDVLIMKDAPKASAFLNKLSGMMRFMLYETKTEWVPLAKELAYIENYIDLQKIRTSDPDYVRYEVTGNPDGIVIAPMIFISFIENAFKHATVNQPGNRIYIRIDIKEDQLLFCCENSYGKTFVHETGGLGNQLISKRLELIYPGKHSLNVIDNGAVYQTKISIELDGH